MHALEHVLSGTFRPLSLSLLESGKRHCNATQLVPIGFACSMRVYTNGDVTGRLSVSPGEAVAEDLLEHWL